MSDDVRPTVARTADLLFTRRSVEHALSVGQVKGWSTNLVMINRRAVCFIHTLQSVYPAWFEQEFPDCSLPCVLPVTPSLTFEQRFAQIDGLLGEMALIGQTSQLLFGVEIRRSLGLQDDQPKLVMTGFPAPQIFRLQPPSAEYCTSIISRVARLDVEMYSGVAQGGPHG